MKNYRFFDLCIASALPLSGPLECTIDIPDWTVEMLTGVDAEPQPNWFHS